MNDPTKNVEDIKQSISEHFRDVDTTVSTTAKDLGLLTKDIIQKESAVMQSFKDQAVQNLKDVQHNYTEKEEKVLSLLNPTKYAQDNSKLSNDYESILQENVDKLKVIAKDDFENAKMHNQKLIEETKNKLHNLITGAFTENDNKNDFAVATGTIFANVNQKIRDDLQLRSDKVGRTTSTLSPDIANVFVHPRQRPLEEIEAERLLNQLFEEQLLEFNEQVKEDFGKINGKMVELVDTTKARLNENMHKVIQGKSVEATESKSIPNIPASSAVGRNVQDLLNRSAKDFQQVNEVMLKDVDDRKQKINDTTRYYAEKMLGKHMPGYKET